MTMPRRAFLRGGLVAAGAVVGGQLLGPLASHAVSPARVRVARGLTSTSSLAVGPADANGYRSIVVGPAEDRLLREGLGLSAAADRADCREHVVTFVQLSDVHIVDHQSPGRLEYLDRFDDPSPAPVTGITSSAYRPQEPLSAHVADSMVQAINALPGGPVLGAPLQFAIETGDNSDNAQFNEIRWNIDILDGGDVTPDSGDLNRYEGVMDQDFITYDTHYWHPEVPPALRNPDEYKTLYGFPTVPGLMDAARATFAAQGLAIPWYSVFGNHDGLVQGNFPPSSLPLSLLTTGSLKITSLPTGISQADLANALASADPQAALTALVVGANVRTVTADPDRRVLTRDETVAEHFTTTGAPVGHGFTAQNQADGTAYYTFDVGDVRMVVMDTVNPNGYSNGSLDEAQFTWLQSVIDATTDKAVILFSHHTADTMDNPLILTGLDPSPRVTGDTLVAYLLTKPQVIAWVNGHTHKNQIFEHARTDGTGGFWEINTASHIDFPQQARVIEIANNNDRTISIFTTILDHAAPAEFDGNLDSVLSLAALSRELSANDPQSDNVGQTGDANERNLELIVQAPAGFSATCLVDDGTDTGGTDTGGGDDGGSAGGGSTGGTNTGGSATPAAASSSSGSGRRGTSLPGAGAPAALYGVAAAGTAAVAIGEAVRKQAGWAEVVDSGLPRD